MDRKDYWHVTGVLDSIASKELEAWKLRVGGAEARRISAESKKIGTELHRYIEATLLKEKPPMTFNTASILNVKRAASAWLADHQPIAIVGIEETIYLDDLELVGTPDLVTVTEVIDWKTSAKIYPTYYAQVNVYLKMANDRYQVSPSLKTGRIVRLDKDLGIYEQKTFDYDETVWDGFCGLLHWLKKKKELEERYG